MSKEVGRYQVFRTTRVRNTLKDDSCWIHKSKEEKAGEDATSSNPDEESKPSLTRMKSYVLMTAQKFGSVDSSVIPSLPKTEVTLSEGDTASHPNGDVIPAQPNGSTVETAVDTKSQAPTEEHIQNGEALPETNGETKEENGEAAGDKSNVEHSNGEAEVPADVHVEECIQPVPSVVENTEAVSPVEPPEQQPAIATAEKMEEPADTPADPSNTDHSEATVPAGANVVDPAAEISAADGTVDSNGTADIQVAAALIAEIKPEEDSPLKAEPANVVDVEDEVSTPPEGESCEKTPAEEAAEEIIAAPAEFRESLPEPIIVTDTASEEQASLQVSVDSVPDIVESVSKSPSQPAVEITAEDGSDKGPVESATEIVESAAEVVVESLPETPAVNETAQEEEVVPDNAVQPVPDVVSEPPAPAEDGSDEGPAEHSEVKVEAAAEVVVESSTETPAVTEVTQIEEAASPSALQPVPDVVSEPPAPPAADGVAKDSGDTHLAEPVTEAIVEAAAEAVVESSPETPAVDETAQEEEVVPDNAVQSVPDVVSEPPAPAENGSDEGPAEHSEVKVEAAADVVVESSTETPAVTEVPQAEEAASPSAVQPVPDVVSEPPAPPAADGVAKDRSDTHLAEPVTEAIVEAAAEAVVESSPETPAVDETTPEEDASLSAAQPPDPPAPETVITPVTCEVESAGRAEPVLTAATVEVVESEVQPVESNTTVEQTVEPTPESETNHVAELDIRDALDTAASEAEAVQDKGPDPAIKLSDALDVEPPATEAVPEPVEDPKPDHSEESKPSQQCDDASTSEAPQKPADESSTNILNTLSYVEGMCSFCNQKIGNIKITLSDPPVQCHPECLKCGICALILGDLVNPMFLRGQVIQCGSCVAGARKI